MKALFASSLVLLSLAVTLCIAGQIVYDANYCDPFPKNKIIAEYSTCSSDLSIGSNDQGILINALLFAPEMCPSPVDRVVNRTIDRRLGPMWTETSVPWTLSYTIMWTDPSANCVFGPPDIGTDQNGFTNEPLEDINQYALYKWYTRQFNIEANRTIDFSISCASSSSATRHVAAVVKEIKWNVGIFEDTFYQPSPCPSCPAASVPHARCLPIGGEDRYGRDNVGWVYTGDYFAETLETGMPLNVTGNVVANELYLGDSLYTSGCFFSYDRETGHSDGNNIKIYAIAGKPIQVVMNAFCAIPNFEIIPIPYHSFPGMANYRKDCENYIYDSQKILVTQYGSLDQTYTFSIFASGSAITCPDLAREVNKADIVTFTVVLSVVIPVVCLVGIAVGVFFAIKKHRQQKQKKQKEGLAKSSFANSLPDTFVMTKEDVHEAAVQH